MRKQVSFAAASQSSAARMQSIHCEVGKLTHTLHASSSAHAASERQAPILTHTTPSDELAYMQAPRWQKEVDTEAGMLSGISRKRRMRSGFYWLTEICNSQCLSHFAAPFIVV